MRRWRSRFTGSVRVCAISFFAALAFVSVSSDGEGLPAMRAALFLGGICLLSAFAAPVFGILALRESGRARESRRVELAAAQRHGHDEGCRLTALLLAGGRLEPLTVWGVVLDSDEHAYLDLQANYARFYGRTATYRHVSGVFFGHPRFVAAGVAMTALGNAVHRSQARADAMQCWRDQCATRVIATDRRLICLVSGQWRSFSYDAVTAFHPEPISRSAVFEFSGAAPLALFGPPSRASSPTRPTGSTASTA